MGWSAWRATWETGPEVRGPCSRGLAGSLWSLRWPSQRAATTVGGSPFISTTSRAAPGTGHSKLNDSTHGGPARTSWSVVAGRARTSHNLLLPHAGRPRSKVTVSLLLPRNRDGPLAQKRGWTASVPPNTSYLTGPRGYTLVKCAWISLRHGRLDQR